MTENEKNKIEQPSEGEAAAVEEKSNVGKNGGLIKYLIFGVAGISIVAAITFGVLYMFKAEPKSTESDATEEVAVETKKSPVKAKSKKQNTEVAIEGATEEIEDEYEDDFNEFALDEDDQKAIDRIVSNLAFLDYEPSSDEIADADDQLMVEDTVEQMNFIKQEKEALTKRAAELDLREKDLVKREKNINSKITRLEQAESNKVSKLAKLYDGMDSRAVAQLMMNLDDETVVSIIPRMKSKNASAVLQLIPSKRAAKLSKKMLTIAGN
jgi:flagellar motility protein MotE (MotC chaperone)